MFPPQPRDTGPADVVSSLHVDADFHRSTLTVAQRPFLEWCRIAMGVCVVLWLVLSIALSLPGPDAGSPLRLLLGVLLMVVVLVPIPGLLMGIRWRRAATFRLSPAELRVDAWEGSPGRPARRTLALVGLQVEGEAGVSFENRESHVLRLVPASGPPMRLGNVLCSAAELDQLVTTLAAAAGAAVERGSQADQEMPAELARIRGRETS